VSFYLLLITCLGPTDEWPSYSFIYQINGVFSIYGYLYVRKKGEGYSVGGNQVIRKNRQFNCVSEVFSLSYQSCRCPPILELDLSVALNETDWIKT